jgi:anti-sigma B factor antagonist
MEINAKHNDNKSVITVNNNKLIGVESEIFQNAVQELINKGSKKILVDLSKVEFISSWGIGLLVHAYTTCHNKNIAFAIGGINPQVMNVLNQLKLTEIFDIA